MFNLPGVDDLFRFFSNTLEGEQPFYSYTQSNPVFPPMNIYESKDHKYIVFEIALAGFEKEDIKIHSEDEFLYISAEKEAKKYEDVYMFKNNLRTNSFSRAFEFPDKYYDFRNPKCSFKNGLLTVRIDKNPDLVSEKKSIVIE
jgi:molecular chaperone IbpA